MKSIKLVFLVFFSVFVVLATQGQADDSSIGTTTPISAEQVLSLDRGWRFFPGDIPFPPIISSYEHAKAGGASGAAAPDFDDSAWRVLHLPHDWAVEQPFDQKLSAAQGYRPRGIGWYRRYIRLDPSDRGHSLELKFDGVVTNCTVWVNGTVVHRNWCGYTGFSVDLTPFATYGDQLNCVAIRVDANEQEGWWYEGAGIYRHTWLIKRNAVHLITDGVRANPIRKSDGAWEIPVEAMIENDGTNAVSIVVAVEVLDPDGRIVTHATTVTDTPPLNQATAEVTIPIANPRLWSVDAPILYTVRTTISQGGIQTDQRSTRCGFRTIRFDAEKGFFLNDQSLKIKGTCNHQDAAGLGVAVPDSIWNYRIRRLKELGSNAYRCAHNPPAQELLDACDRMGMLVMDENRNFNASPDYIGQLEWMVRRDRNHPSVILWSVFNEEPTQGTEVGYELVRRMKAAVKRLDATRPVTAAMSGGIGSPINVSQAVDVVGFNYQQGLYDQFHHAHPSQPIMSSEDTSSFMTRGVYEENDKICQAECYDDSAAPWGETHRDAWKTIATRPFVAGGFVWTGFDYRGEPLKFSWPAVSSVFGIMDACGFPKAAYYMHQAAWIDDKPILHLAPHWNWRGNGGQPIKVLALTNADTVELFLNGVSLGLKNVDRLVGGEWEVNYEPGKLEAVAKKDGREVARFAEETTGDPVSLKLTPDRGELAGDGADTEPVTVSAVDAQGREVPTANLPVTFALTGPATIIGTGNGDNTSHEPDKGNQRSLFNGLAQVILQSQRESSGTVMLTAKATGLAPATAEIQIKSVPQIPSVPPTEHIFTLAKWRMSPPRAQRPNPQTKLSDGDMNSWSDVQAGTLQNFGSGTWVAYQTTFTPPSINRNKNEGWLRFKEISGTAEVWENGQLIGQKKEAVPTELRVKLTDCTKSITITVLVNSSGSPKAGLSGAVIIEAFLRKIEEVNYPQKGAAQRIAASPI